MVNETISSLIGLGVEILVIVLIAASTMVATKVKKHISTNTELKNNILAQQLVDTFIAYAEKEFKGSSGIEKRDYVLGKVVEALTKRGIKVDTEELLASIERGVNATKTK